MMKYKGYIGVAKVDDEAGVIRGKVVNTRDTITFQGETVEAARATFHESVDDYLEFCQELGKEPDKPYPGKILLRLHPDVHRGISIVAQIQGLSVNRLVNRELKRAVRRAGLLTAAEALEAARTPRGVFAVLPDVSKPRKATATRRAVVESDAKAVAAPKIKSKAKTK